MTDEVKSHYDVIYPDSIPEGVTLQKNVYATMRDNIKLAMDVYLPSEGEGPWPVIIGYAAYRKEFFFESALPAFYCPKGYVLVQLQARGSGQSQGRFCFHGENEANDGYDAVEWIAEQSWCNGNVGMMGASYFGVNQWITAIKNPPHLKCIVPCPGTTDNYRGMIYPGGVFRSGFVNYIVTKLFQESIWPGPIPGKELPDNILCELFAHTEDGPFFWEHGGAWRYMDKIKVPVLTIAPAANDLHITQHLRIYNEIKAPKKLIISPWAGTRYQPFIFDTEAINLYLIRWFDHWLKGVDTGIMDEPEVAIYDNGTGKWQYEREYPLARTEWKQFFLHKNQLNTQPWGCINDRPPGQDETPESFQHPSEKEFFPGSFLLAPNPENAQFLGFITPPLDEALTIMGPVSITLFASTTEQRPSDWSFFVKVGEMGPGGPAMNPVTQSPHLRPDWTDPWTPKDVNLWSYGNLRTKFREVDEARSRPGQPWHPFQNPKVLQPDTVYEFQIELVPIFNTFKKGHRIWVQIACEDKDYNPWDAASAYAVGPPPLSSKVTLYHDEAHPSHLILPVIPEAPEFQEVESPLCDFVPGSLRFR